MSSQSGAPAPSLLRQKLLLVLVTVIALVLAGWALKYTRVVTMPLVFGFFVTLLVWPVYHWQRNRLPDRFWWVALASTMLLILLVLAAAFGVAWYVVDQVASANLAEQSQGLRDQWQRVQEWLESRNLPTGNDLAGTLGSRAGDIVGYLVSWLADFAAMLVLIFFFTLLMLLESENWRRKSEHIFRSSTTYELFDAIGAASSQVRSYLYVRTFVSALSAVAAGLWLWIIGVPFPLLWALLTFLLNYVPNVGSIVSGAMATAVAALALGLGPALLTAGGLFTIEQIIGNYIDPLLTGRRLEISPLIVLVSVLLWAWIWGAAGAVLAVPITATLIIVLAHVPAVRPIALLLSRTSNEEKLRTQTHDHQPTAGQ